MQIENKGPLSDMGTNLSATADAYGREGQPVAAIIATSGAVLLCALMGVIETLEEIRDELRAGNGNGREGK